MFGRVRPRSASIKILPARPNATRLGATPAQIVHILGPRVDQIRSYFNLLWPASANIETISAKFGQFRGGGTEALNEQRRVILRFMARDSGSQTDLAELGQIGPGLLTPTRFRTNLHSLVDGVRSRLATGVSRRSRYCRALLTITLDEPCVVIGGVLIGADTPGARARVPGGLCPSLYRECLGLVFF